MWVNQEFYLIDQKEKNLDEYGIERLVIITTTMKQEFEGRKEFSSQISFNMKQGDKLNVVCFLIGNPMLSNFGNNHRMYDNQDDHFNLPMDIDILLERLMGEFRSFPGYMK